MKRAILILSVIIMLSISLTACSNTQDDGVKFGARAAYAISRHIGDDPEKSPKSFTINYMECQLDSEYYYALAELSLLYPDGTYSRVVYRLSTGGEFYETKLAENKAVFDEPMQLYIINDGDAVIAKKPDYTVDAKEVLKIFNEYVKTGNDELFKLSSDGQAE